MDDVTCIERLKEKDAEIDELVERLEQSCEYFDIGKVKALIAKHRGVNDMGDNRISVKIEITGIDGEIQKLDWWINWNEDWVNRLYADIVELNNKAGLPVRESPFDYL